MRHAETPVATGTSTRVSGFPTGPVDESNDSVRDSADEVAARRLLKRAAEETTMQIELVLELLLPFALTFTIAALRSRRPKAAGAPIMSTIQGAC